MCPRVTAKIRSVRAQLYKRPYFSVITKHKQDHFMAEASEFLGTVVVVLFDNFVFGLDACSLGLAGCSFPAFSAAC